MKPKNVMKVGLEPKYQEDNGKKTNILQPLRKPMKEWHWSLLFLFALASAIVIRLIAQALINSDTIGFVWEELLIVGVSLIILIAIAAVSKNSIIGGTVVTLVFLFTIVRLINHDYGDKAEKLADVSELEEDVSYDKSNRDYLLLRKDNTYVYDLALGQETPWRGFPAKELSGYGFYSDTYDYIVIFSDGASYKGGEDKVIPIKRHLFFKIKANSPQKVYVTVF